MCNDVAVQYETVSHFRACAIDLRRTVATGRDALRGKLVRITLAPRLRLCCSSASAAAPCLHRSTSLHDSPVFSAAASAASAGSHSSRSRLDALQHPLPSLREHGRAPKGWMLQHRPPQRLQNKCRRSTPTTSTSGWGSPSARRSSLERPSSSPRRCVQSRRLCRASLTTWRPQGLISAADQHDGFSSDSHSYLKNGLWWAGMLTSTLSTSLGRASGAQKRCHRTRALSNRC